MYEYTKKERQKKLRSIIERLGTGDQQDMLDALQKEGIETTQATISRDLQEMGYVKVRVGPGKYRYEKLNADQKTNLNKKLASMFHEFVTDIKSTGNIILVKTVPGHAGGVASLIDNIENPKILGTVAGDDTIIIVLNDENDKKEIEQHFLDLL